MNRRDSVFALLALGVTGAASGADAQQVGKMPRIGFLQATQNENVVAFIQALREAHYIDGETAVIETRLYGTRPDQVRGDPSPNRTSGLRPAPRLEWVVLRRMVDQAVHGHSRPDGIAGQFPIATFHTDKRCNAASRLRSATLGHAARRSEP